MSEGKKFQIRQPRVKIPTPLSEIEPIEEGSLTPRSKEDLVHLVEPPLLEACQVLFDKGVQTWMSSANKKDIQIGEVHVIIDFDTLSPQNKEVALKHGELSQYMNKNYIKISMPVNEKTTAGEISRHMTAVAHEFVKQ